MLPVPIYFNPNEDFNAGCFVEMQYFSAVHPSIHPLVYQYFCLTVPTVSTETTATSEDCRLGSSSCQAEITFYPIGNLRNNTGSVVSEPLTSLVMAHLKIGQDKQCEEWRQKHPGSSRTDFSGVGGEGMFTHLLVWVHDIESLSAMQLISVYVPRANQLYGKLTFKRECQSGDGSSSRRDSSEGEPEEGGQEQQVMQDSKSSVGLSEEDSWHVVRVVEPFKLKVNLVAFCQR